MGCPRIKPLIRKSAYYDPCKLIPTGLRNVVSFHCIYRRASSSRGTRKVEVTQQQQRNGTEQYLQHQTTMTTASPPTKPSPSPSPSPSSSSSSSSPAIQTTQRASSIPQDECAICCYLLPLKPNEWVYKECCGTTLCMGCILSQKRVRVIGENMTLPWKGSQDEEREYLR